MLSLSDFRGRRNVVLFFYHQDDSELCTAEAEAFRDLQPQFEETGSAILGVSKDSILDHDSFARKSKLKYYLLSDEDRVVWNAYSTCRGEGHLSPDDRLTCVIDKEGIVRRIWPQVSVQGHAEEVLEYISGL